MKLTTYVNFAGKCAEAFHNYEQHLGAGVPKAEPMRSAYLTLKTDSDCEAEEGL